jgi:F0F1-type ATP synthase alpha subunit
MGDNMKDLPNEDKLAEVEQFLQQLQALPVSHERMVTVLTSILWGDLKDTTTPKAITKETLVRVLLSIVTKRREEITTPTKESELSNQKSTEIVTHMPKSGPPSQKSMDFPRSPP